MAFSNKKEFVFIPIMSPNIIGSNILVIAPRNKKALFLFQSDA
jgi:hypothetical protein